MDKVLKENNVRNRRRKTSTNTLEKCTLLNMQSSKYVGVLIDLADFLMVTR